MTNDPRKARFLDLCDNLGDNLCGDHRGDAASVAASASLHPALTHHEAAPLAGHVMLDLLEDHGFAPDDIDAVVATTPMSIALTTATMCAASSRGLDLDSVMMCDGEPLAAIDLDGASLVLCLDRDDPTVRREVSENLHARGAHVVGWATLTPLAVTVLESAEE